MSDLSAQLRPASFRGVGFEVSAADLDAGRRVQVHEYPQRDMPWAEDLGRATREIAIEGFLIGADYVAQVGRLLSALETPGAGTLVHPWLGALQVALAAPARVHFDAGLGQATVSMSFVEAGELTFPASTASTQAASRATADGLAAAAISDFSATFQAAGLQSFVAAAAQGQLASMLGVVSAGQVAQILGMATGSATLAAEAFSFVNDPATLGNVLLNAFGLSNAAGAVAAWSSAVKLILATVSSPVMQAPTASLHPTPSRRQIDANAAAIFSLGRQLLLAQATGMSTLVASDQDNPQAGLAALTQQDYGTSGQSTVLPTGVTVSTVAGITQPQTATQQVTRDIVLSVRDALLAALDAEMGQCGDATYDALQDARAAVYADLTSRAQSAETLTTMTPAQTMPMLVVAFELYADATRDAEILLRNGIRHPSFVPPQPLSVLTA